MEAILTLLFYGAVVFSIVRTIRKKKGLPTRDFKTMIPTGKESGAMPHAHAKPGKYDTYNKKTKFHSKESGSMPHEHKNDKYRSMADASNLPKGYILLNGEPVRVADLEDK